MGRSFITYYLLHVCVTYLTVPSHCQRLRSIHLSEASNK